MEVYRRRTPCSICGSAGYAKEKYLANWHCWQWALYIRNTRAYCNELDVELDERGNVKATEKTYQTNIPKIFTAGDMRRGQSLVVWAISEGRECARQVDEYLMGHSILETKDQNNLIALKQNIYCIIKKAATNWQLFYYGQLIHIIIYKYVELFYTEIFVNLVS